MDKTKLFDNETLDVLKWTNKEWGQVSPAMSYVHSYRSESTGLAKAALMDW